MASNKERFEGIDAQLRAIEGHLGISPEVARQTSFWPQTLTEWSQIIGVALAIFVAACGVSLYLGSLMVDRHIQSAIQPIQTDIQQTKGDVREIRGIVSVLQAQIAVDKYASAPPQELKNHRDELANAKTTLADAPRNTPNFWPTTFQVLTLLSQATSNLSIQNEQKESELDTVVSNPPGQVGPFTNQRIVLKHLVSGITFINSIVRLDPSVQLANDTFINCVFIFPLEGNPQNNLQQIGSELLAADLAHTTIKGS